MYIYIYIHINDIIVTIINVYVYIYIYTYVYIYIYIYMQEPGGRGGVGKPAAPRGRPRLSVGAAYSCSGQSARPAAAAWPA